MATAVFGHKQRVNKKQDSNVPFTGQINLGRVAVELLGLLGLLLMLLRELMGGSFFLDAEIDLISSVDSMVRESGGDSSIFPFDA